jgi:hypothetical protein
VSKPPLKASDRVEILRRPRLLVALGSEANDGGGCEVGDFSGGGGVGGTDLGPDQPVNEARPFEGQFRIPGNSIPTTSTDEKQWRPLPRPEPGQDRAQMLGQVMDVLGLDVSDRGGDVLFVRKRTIDDDQRHVRGGASNDPLQHRHLRLQSQPQLFGRFTFGEVHLITTVHGLDRLRVAS